MGMYEDMLRQKREHELMEATKSAAVSGAGYGGIGGALLSVLGGEKSVPKIIAKSLLAAAPSAALSAGSVYGGTKLMGTPDDDEDTPYTNRGALGGGLGGAIGGGTLGALLASGKLRGLGSIAGKVGEKVGLKGSSLFDNLLTDRIKKWAMAPGGRSAAKGAALLGGAGAAGGTYWGGGEGMTLDAMRGMLEDDEDHL